jgi:hypothetical protein
VVVGNENSQGLHEYLQEGEIECRDCRLGLIYLKSTPLNSKQLKTELAASIKQTRD